MKHIIKTAIIASSLVLGAGSALAAPEGFGIQYPETFDNAHGITYPELP